MKRRVARKKQRLSLTGTRNSCLVCRQPTVTKPLRSTQDVLACLTPFRDRRQEYFVSLSLDSGGRLIKRRVVTIGLLNSGLVHPREVFAGSLSDRAAAVIIAHNHPSGVAEPSKADIEATEQLVRAGKILDVPLRDHIVITGSGYFSFREQGLIRA
jgi:DNA repair protein RadC